MIKDYVAALKAALQAGQKPDQVFSQLEAVLAKRGHSKLQNRILETLLREFGHETGSTQAVLTVAREKDATGTLVAQLTKELSVTNPLVVIDETIIGGAKLRANHMEIDATYKTALINLYHTITK